jgi:hypothetical protein
LGHVWFTLGSDRTADIGVRQLRANSDSSHRSNGLRYSITPSARLSKPSGIVKPTALAALTLIANS